MSMKKRFLIIILLVLSVGFISVNAKASMTIATFGDPAIDSNTPLFTVDFTEMTFNGGWGDDKTGLTLDIPYSGHTFTNAWFEMTEVGIIDAFGDTGGGEINFYQDGDSTGPLIIINFDSGHVDYHGFGADEFFAENVTITGSEITGTLSEEQFTFSFANLGHLEGSQNWNDGFTATAAFTSSAVPEPATICLLCLSALALRRRSGRALSKRRRA
jgi:hypothetical protein